MGRILSLLLCAAASHALRVGVGNKTLIAYLGRTPVLDGVIDPAEWADAVTEAGILQWDPEFEPVIEASPTDLDLTLWVKHDTTHLYFAFQVTDDVLYGFQTPSWLPSANPMANNLTQQVRVLSTLVLGCEKRACHLQGWPWFGDEMELLLNPGNLSGYENTTVPGNASAWQMVRNWIGATVPGPP